jgi:hypothetical protein
MTVITQQVISRQNALENKLPRYFDGKSCVNGHIAEKYVVNNRCLECAKLTKEKIREKKRTVRDTRNKARKEAIDNNLPRYFTGVPCKNGHTAERYTKGKDCVECVRFRMQQTIEKQKAIVQETGTNRYFSGEPCINGHIAERYIVKNKCVECERIKKAKQRAKRKRELGADGQTTYSPGKPCNKGHNAKRFISNNICVECKRIQQEKARRKAGMLTRDERNKLRKKAAEARKKEQQQKTKDSKLTSKERAIIKYARKCFQTSSKGRYSTGSIPTNIAELENGYDTEQLNTHLRQYSNTWRNKKSKRKWHIDHIIPLSILVKKGVTELYILNSLDNLQLLSPSQNLKKGSALVDTEEEIDEFISRKRGNKKPMGLYDPSERITTLVNSEAERIYKVITASTYGTEHSIKASKITTLRAIKSDIWKGYDYFSQKNSYDDYDISVEFSNQRKHPDKEGLLYLLFEEHLEKKNKKGFFKRLFE